MDRKEAIEVVRKKVDYYEADKRLKAALEALIPELAESEDERNWKAVLGYVKDDALRVWLEKQKEQKPKMTPKWLYRLEFKDSSCGLWYDGSGKWCFESGIGSIDGCKTKTLPMDYDAKYKQDGRDWFSSCSRKEDLMHWYSLEDAKELISKGFVFTRYLATEYHEYDQQTVFIKETALCREQIDIFELFGQKSAEWSEEDEKTIDEAAEYIEKYAEHVQGGYSKQYVLDLARRVDSLRPQPKQEWSEEDKKMLGKVMECITYVADHNLLDGDVSETSLKAWLLSHLTHSPHWRRAKEGSNLPESIIIPDGEEPRFGKCAVRDSYYIPISELKELPKE